MSKLLNDSTYMLNQVRDLENSIAALEQAAERIAGYNVRLRSFLLELTDPEQFGHAVSDEVRARATALLTNSHDIS